MDRILSALEDSFPLTPGLEYTIEAGRPETLTDGMLDVLASHPVSRVCVNPQSMNQATLDRIGRLHEAAAVREAIGRARGKGRGWHINSDLILGLPGEGPADVGESLGQVLDLRPDNVTLHGLAIKRGSAYKEGKEGLPDRLLGLEMTDLCRGMLHEAGYRPYYLYRQKDSLAGGENVGYSLLGKECLYNILMIEERQTILGLGAGAGSKFLRRGSWSLDNIYNPKDLIQYIQRVDDSIRRKVDKLAQLG
jgi:oxygen-independent coproporphyrinogen-3 oxidase